VRLDQDQIIQCDLERGIARARPAKCLFDVRAQGKHATTIGRLVAARDHGQGPNDLNHLRGGINKIVDKVDFAIALPNQ